MACDPNYLFHIDNHVMTVIEADGINHRPTEVDQVQIFAGEALYPRRQNLHFLKRLMHV